MSNYESFNPNGLKVGEELATVATPPTYCLLEDGAPYSRATYPILSALLPAPYQPGITAVTARTLPSSSAWQDLAAGPSRTVAIATGSAVAYTDDGDTWTAGAGVANTQLVKAAYGNGVWVAVGQGSGGNPDAARTTDGITWSSVVLPGTINQAWNNVAYGNGVFVITKTGTNQAATSPDGVTWTTRTLAASVATADLFYANGKFILLPDSNTTAQYSTDGITWSTATMPSSGEWAAGAYGNGVYVALRNSSTAYATSPDGVTWTARTFPVTVSLANISYGDVFAVAISSTTSLYKSADGITWVAASNMPSTADWRTSTFGLNKFLFLVNGTTTSAASSNVTLDATKFGVPVHAANGAMKYYIRASYG